MTPEGYLQRELIDCFAIWDTGATNSLISIGLAEKLGLVASGIETVVGVHGSKQCQSYFLDVILNDAIVIPAICVTEGYIGDDIDFLVGMDIIARGDFSLTTKMDERKLKSCFSFRYPSNQKPIDYTANFDKEQNS